MQFTHLQLDEDPAPGGNCKTVVQVPVVAKVTTIHGEANEIHIPRKIFIEK